ncbi:MAG: TSUP family transporter, partial [Nodosilinea sp.]
MDLGIVDIGILFGIAAIAGCIDTIAGGGGLITLPTMLMVGVPPAAALATSKLQSTGGSLTASLYFLKQRAVRLQD